MKRLRYAVFMLLLLGGAAWARAEDPNRLYPTIRKTATGSGAASAITFWTPATGKRFNLQWCNFSSINAASFRLQVSAVDIVPPIIVTSLGSVPIGGVWGNIHSSAFNDVLTYTVATAGLSAGSQSWSIICSGWED